MDWNKIKAEYIAGGTSYRKLAEKYGVKFSNLKNVAIKEGWTHLKEQTKNKADTKIVNSVANDISKNAIKINDVADKLLDKILVLLNDEAVELGSQSIKNLTSSLKDIKNIKDVKSEIDLEEQQARIDKLRKDTENNDGENDKPCGVLLMPDVMESPAPPSEVDDDE